MLLLLFPVELQLLVSHMINHVFYFYRVLFLAAPKVAEVPPPAEPVEVAQDEEDWDKEDEVEVIQKVEEIKILGWQKRKRWRSQFEENQLYSWNGETKKL